MTAAEFVTAIRAITPNESEFSMMPEGFAQIYLGELHIGDKKGHHITDPNDAVIDLINNYDVSKLEKPRAFDPFGHAGLSPLVTI